MRDIIKSYHKKLKCNNRIIRKMRIPGTRNAAVAAVWSTSWQQTLKCPKENARILNSDGKPVSCLLYTSDAADE